MSYQIIQGDCIEGMKTLPDQCVHTVITSPPYYGLRDYGTATWEGGDAECDHIEYIDTGTRSTLNNSVNGIKSPNTALMTKRQYKKTCRKCGAQRIDQQIGLEETPEAYVQRLVDVFREVRRILRDDGTVWLNLGDSYGAKKQLLGIPWRVAFALQADGWYLRQDIIWHKPNVMPESVTDRCTKSHEYIFLLSKSQRYYFDHEVIKEPFADTRNENPNGGGDYAKQAYGSNPQKGLSKGVWNKDGKITGRNKRSVWSIATRAYKEAHFAVYPPKLIEPCVLAGTSEKGCCATCGVPFHRVAKKIGEFQRRWSTNNAEGSPYQSQGSKQNIYETVKWQSPCTCDSTIAVPCTVFDPFTGSGTTAIVALQHKRNFLGTELNQEYIDIAEKRIRHWLAEDFML